jgi:TATA-box binding protein (TBP) (component of TFIID and TFIIIB)
MAEDGLGDRKKSKLQETQPLLLDKVKALSELDIIEYASQVARQQRYETLMLQRLRSIGPDPLPLSVAVLDNNPFGIREFAHHRPKRIPGAMEHNAPEDPLQFGNAVVLPQEVRESGISMPWLVNVTATFFSGVTFDLKQQAYMNPNWPGHFNTLRFRTLTTKVLSDARPVPSTASCKVYNSGLVSITNTRSPQQALLSAHTYVGILRRAGIYDAQMLNFKVDNLVAASDFGFRVRLQCMVRSIADPRQMDYDPEKFPAAIYREKTLTAPGEMSAPPESRVAVLIFASGKMICVGFRCVEQLLDVHVKINRIARAFICDPNDVANANGGLQPQQEQQMADVDHLMYELICINAPEKAMALLTQPAPVQTPHASSMSLNALGFDDLTRPSLHPAAETEQYIQANTPYLGRLTYEGVQALHEAVNTMATETNNISSIGGSLALLNGL